MSARIVNFMGKNVMAVSGNDKIIQDAITEVIGTIRLGIRTGRLVPLSVLASRLDLAIEDYDREASST